MSTHQLVNKCSLNFSCGRKIIYRVQDFLVQLDGQENEKGRTQTSLVKAEVPIEFIIEKKSKFIMGSLKMVGYI